MRTSSDPGVGTGIFLYWTAYSLALSIKMQRAHLPPPVFSRTCAHCSVGMVGLAAVAYAAFLLRLVVLKFVVILLALARLFGLWRGHA